MVQLLKKFFIKGIPYGQRKVRGDVGAPKRWTEEIIRQTKGFEVKEDCELRAIFILPPDKYPTDLRYGPDLDNLLKRLQDALNETIFSKAPGKDSCITKLYAEKQKANSRDTGVEIEIYKL